MKTRTLLMAMAGALTLVGTSASAATLFAAEFNVDGDYGGFVDFDDRVVGDAVSGGTLSGVTAAAGNSDIQFRTGNDLAPLNLALTDVQTLTVRFRSDAGNDGSFDDLSGNALSGFAFWGYIPAVSGGPSGMGNIVGANINLGAATSVTADTDSYFIAVWDLSSLSDGGNDTDSPPDLDYLRFDPTSGNGNGFDVDYIRIDGVPEPGSLALLGLGGLLIARRRRA